MIPTTPTSPPAHRAPTGTRLALPPDPSGSALAGLIRQARTAISVGDVVVDTREACAWSPASALVLERLERLAVSAGRRWHDLADDVPER